MKETHSKEVTTTPKQTLSLKDCYLPLKFDFLSYQKENYGKRNAELEKKIPEYKERYGFSELTAEQANAIDRAEGEKAMCKDCTGAPCRKKDNRYRQPVIPQMDADGFIPMADCDYRAKTASATQYRQGEIPPRYATKTFKDYKVTPDNERAIRLAKWFLMNNVTSSAPKGLFLYGGTGSGKTFLASLIARECKGIVFGDTTTLFDEIKAQFRDGDAQEAINRLCNCAVLILDDLGAGQVTEWNIGILYQVINSRYNACKPLIVTSNFDLKGLKSRLTVKDNRGNVTDAFSSERIISRLSEMCVQGFLGIKDWRKEK